MTSPNEIAASIDSDKKAPRVFTTSNGVNLRLRPVSPFLIMAAQKQIVEPEVPHWYNQDKAREEYNDNDPNYVKALADYKVKQSEIVNDTLLANGVTVVQPLPDDVYPLESDEWAEGIRFLGIDVPDSGLARRVCWLRYHVLGDVEDLTGLMIAITSAGGIVTEEAVEAAADSFRGDEERNTNNENPVNITSINRDTTTDTPRNGESV